MRHVADRFTVVLDANVLYPFLTRDVLLSLSQVGLFRARWSSSIQDEWTRKLLAKRPEKQTAIRRMVEIMNAEFPEAMIEGFEDLIPALSLPDPDDRHVLAAAIHGGAQHIITNNGRHFPAHALDPYGIEARSPDEFILSTFELYQSDCIHVLARMRREYDRPPMTGADLIVGLARTGLPRTAAALKPHIEGL